MEKYAKLVKIQGREAVMQSDCECGYEQKVILHSEMVFPEADSDYKRTQFDTPCSASH